MSTHDESGGVAAEEVFVLHLPDGLVGTEWQDGHLARLQRCEKIVIGTPSGRLDRALPNGIQSWPQGLRVLHLWGLTDLRSLPSFDGCPDLETIDLGGCVNLADLPAIKGLSALEWLDLKDCGALRKLPDCPPPCLQFLYLEGCRGMDSDELEHFLHDLGRNGQLPQLIELDLSRTNLERLPKFRWSAYWDDEDIEGYDDATRWSSRRWLEKIVLKGCTELGRIALPLGELPNLRHLNVANCPKLKELPELPAVRAYPRPWPQSVLQYLQVDGSGIDVHAGSSIRQHHRKEGVGIPSTHRNAAETFLAWQHFGDPVPFPECRLMLLGNSMAGKTNLMRRLLFGVPGADPDGYVEPEGGRDQWRPNEGLDSTHPIHCPTWRVRVDGFEQPASVHVWDYGGQHKYHRSHRTFVREGTLFVLVWRHPAKRVAEVDERREAELRDGEEPVHSLEYWLDFIVASGVCEPDRLREHVVIVCAQAQDQFEQAGAEALTGELGRYANAGLSNLLVETVNLGCNDPIALHHWNSLWHELRGRLARTIDGHGSPVPRLFATVAEEVAADRRQCEVWRAQKSCPVEPAKFRQKAFPSQEQWLARLAEGRGAVVDTPHVRAITRCLHDAGSLFWLRPAGRSRDRFVIVDQAAALHWVYRFLGDGFAKTFQEGCRARGGWFDRDDLWCDKPQGAEGEEPKRLFDEAWQQNLALDLMEQCRLILSDGERFVATEDALLPDLADVAAAVHARRQRWRRNGAVLRADVVGSQSEPIGEDVFQDFRAWSLGQLRRYLKAEAFYLHKGGLQVEVNGAGHWEVLDPERRQCWPERFLLEVFWQPFEPHCYGGAVHVFIHAKDEDHAAKLQTTLLGEQGLWRDETSPLGKDVESRAGGEMPFLLLDAAARGTFPFGVSCRRAHPVAARVYERLMGLDPPHPTFYYRGEAILEEIGKDHTERVLGKLGACSVIVLLIDEAYLEPAEENRYCLEELALALFRFEEGNWAKLQHRLRDVDRDLPTLCRQRLGRLYESAQSARWKAAERTVLFVPDFDPSELAPRMKEALGSFSSLLESTCRDLKFCNHPHWFFKRELVQVLLEDGGMSTFSTEIGDTRATISDESVLMQRLEQLAKDIPHG